MAWLLGRRAGRSFGSSSTAAEVTEGVDASALTAIVTGGASGIGAETTRILALRGVHVILAARNLEAAAAVKKKICSEKFDAKLDLLHLDLSSMASVRQFVSTFRSMNLPLNILINNAGVMYCPYQLSQDGIEIHFATNHLGHFLLTSLLLETMKESAFRSKIEGRIVILSSSYHKHAYPEGIRFDKINSSEGYTPLNAYGQSKLANLLHCFELARRLKEDNAPITVNSVHPGFIFTNLQRHVLLIAYLWRVVFFYMWKTIPQGAATTCYASLHPDLQGVSGKYFSDCKEDSPTLLATDTKLAQNLWELSEKMVKL